MSDEGEEILNINLYLTQVQIDILKTDQPKCMYHTENEKFINIDYKIPSDTL